MKIEAMTKAPDGTAPSADATSAGRVVGWQSRSFQNESPSSQQPRSHTGQLIVNADDWGKDSATTDRIFECLKCRTVSATSAMVFMEDSERAAAIAKESGIDAGLHLNLSEPFTAPGHLALLTEHHRKVSAYLRRHALARIFYNPRLANSFEYIVKAQLDEFRRLYGAAPERIDGHHHLHLCANVQRAKLLPAGTLIRRNFSFQAGEKSWLNRSYRRRIDGRLARRHRLMDFLFLLAPLESSRLQRIFSLARQFAVEVETHPLRDEYKFLTGGEMLRQAGDIAIAPGFPAAGKTAGFSKS
jgi:chitin disaccharide deacetylase